MKIFVACELPDTALAKLESLGSELVVAPEIGGDDLAGRLADVAILVVGGTRVSGEAIAAAPALQMIIRTGADVSNIAVEDASAQGVFVVNTPLRDADAIAEFAMAAVLALDRQLLVHAGDLRSGAERPGQGRSGAALDAAGLSGRTLGVLGFGPVSAEIARRAVAFGMQVVAWTPRLATLPAARRTVEFCERPHELARMSHVVMAFSPAESDDGVFVDEEFLSSMRIGASLVLIGHAGAFDDAAIAAAVERRELRVALDIWPPEGSTETVRLRSRLLELPGVIGTVRLADRTRQVQEAVAEAVVQRVRSYVVSGQVVDCVNLLERSPATWQLVLRLRDAVGVMAGIMDAIRTDGINAEEITTRVFAGAKAAWCTIALDERPSNEALRAIRNLPGVLHLELRAMV